MSRAERRFTLGLLAVEDAMLTAVVGPMEIIRVAQKLAQVRDPATPLRLDTVLVGARGERQMAGCGGLALGPVLSPDHPLDLLLVPGYMHASGADALRKLERMGPEIELLRALNLRGVPLAASCCGAFLLAEAGLLDGLQATTSWWLDGVFRKRYPKVRMDVERMYVEDGGVATTGASTAILGYVLRVLARQVDADLAQMTARMLLIDPDRQSQAPYISLALSERPRHSLSEKVEQFLQRELHRDISVGELAGHCGTSERSLLRHFRQHYGVSPLAHIQHLRVERAKALLESTLLSFDEIVERCGYSDPSSFRKLFKRATSLTPADYRERFRLRPH
ncbi:GlxA family transcriptional regulator [Arenimonas fontis]|uniref:Helix-turn-helix domain-containing protein n=1 Tax=Arenimonas fontis TaxID=2608255 RepID=A0A5B2ZA74_9GAMM|nr:helix-turn-helix domain-containing protein [Arenimonas fontis]KAA2285046.1 helix-turn-helix domain-containing protein [Arenimonas fontis]